MKTLIKVDKNGSKHFIEDTCPRCGGSGRYYSFGTCFMCNGSGKYEHKIIERTPEYEQVLADKRKERADKKLEQSRKEAPKRNANFFSKYGFDDEGNAYIVMGNTYEIKDDLKAEGARFNPNLGWYFSHPQDKYPYEKLNRNDFMDEQPDGTYQVDWLKAQQKTYKFQDDYKKYFAPPSSSRWVGEVGQKYSGTLKLISTFFFENHFGYYGGVTGIYKFNDENGNVIVWKTACRDDLEEGNTYNITGTIKDHSDYKGEKQTILTRCKIK